MLLKIVSSKSIVSCVTSPIWPRTSRSRISASGTPSTFTTPVVGSAKRGIRLASVLLPQPFGPTMAIVSPKVIFKLTSSSTALSGW